MREAKGELIQSTRARTIAHRPRELVGSVLERLPLGKGFEAEAGSFLLLGLAAGESGAALDAGVAMMLTDRGWGTRSGAGVNAADAHRGSQPTLDALESMAGGCRTVDAALLVRLARATLFGVTATD